MDNSISKSKLFTASCISLIVTAMTFAIRAGILTDLGVQFELNDTQLGYVNGLAFFGFPVATVIGGLLYNVLGARKLMIIAFVSHIVGLVMTIYAGGLRWLTELLVVSSEIEDVINHLEGEPQLAAELIEAVELRRRATAEHSGRAATVGDQGSRLAVALFKVSLKGLSRVEAVETLFDLTISQIHDHAAEQLHHVEVIEVGEVPAGLGKEKVASEHGNAGVKTAMDRVHTTPGGSLIHHIVVNKRGRVDHFSDLGQASVAGRKFSLL